MNAISIAISFKDGDFPLCDSWWRPMYKGTAIQTAKTIKPIAIIVVFLFLLVDFDIHPKMGRWEHHLLMAIFVFLIYQFILYIFYTKCQAKLIKQKLEIFLESLMQIIWLNIQVLDILSMSENEMLSTRYIFTHKDSE